MTRNRWTIAVLLGGAIAVSYFDRQTLPVAIKAIEREIPVSNTQFSELQAAFLVAYAFLYAGSGKLVDAVGARKGYLIIMLFSSVACASQGLATGLWMLAMSRLLLGMGQGGAFPAATKAVSEWFTAAESATAMGILTTGSSVGAVAAPPLIAIALAEWNWRWMFLLAGVLGLLWCWWWMRTYSSPMAVVVKHEVRIPWLRLLAYRQTWGLVCAKTLSDAAWYYYVFWLPKYLYDARGFNTAQVGVFAWIPYAAAGAGSLCGGWFSSRLIRGGCSVNAARKWALGLSAAVMPVAFFVTRTPVQMAIVIFSIAFFGQQAWATIVMIMPTDLFPKSAVGSVAGLVGFGGAMGGAIFGRIAGYLLDHGYGYSAVFGIASSFHVIGFLIILATVREVRQVAVAEV